VITGFWDDKGPSLEVFREFFEVVCCAVFVYCLLRQRLPTIVAYQLQLLQLVRKLINNICPLLNLLVSSLLQVFNSSILNLLLFLVDLPDDVVFEVEELLVDFELLEFFSFFFELTR